MLRTKLFNLVIAATVMGSTSYAQSLHNNSTITITSQAVLFVRENLVNETSGIIINNGDMQIGGAWQNNGQYDAGDGQITFNSPLPQIINHNDQAFSKLTLRGGGLKIFNANITIEEQLILDDGILFSDNGSKIIITADATVTGGTNRAHINGTVVHEGSGSRIFPLGNGTMYLPVELTSITGTNAAIGITLVEPPAGVQSVISTDIVQVSPKRYWRLEGLSTSSTAPLIVLPIAQDETWITNVDNLVIAETDALSSPFQSLGRSSSPDLTRAISARGVSAAIVALAMENDDRSIEVFNAVSANGDNLNDFMRIRNIEQYPNNRVTIFNRWGDKVFETSGYNNTSNAFRGVSNITGKALPAATYFYIINKNDGSASINGYVVVKGSGN